MNSPATGSAAGAPAQLPEEQRQDPGPRHAAARSLLAPVRFRRVPLLPGPGGPVPAGRRVGGRWLLAAALLAVVSMVALLAVTGGAAAPASGLGDPGALVRWGKPAARLVQDLAANLTVGLLVLRALAVPVGLRVRLDRLSPVERLALRWAAGAAAVWALAAATWYVLAYAAILGAPLADPAVWATLPAFAGQVAVGRVQVQVVVLVVCAGAGALLARGPIVAGAATLLALLALLLPTIVAHAADEAEHGAATLTLAMHVGAAATWAGGLAALVVLRRALGAAVASSARDFSLLAAICFAIVGVTGVIGVGVRIPTWEQASLPYLAVAAIKVAAYAGLGAAGWQHRRRALSRLDTSPGSGSAFWRLIGLEVLVMAVAVGSAVVLNQLPAVD